MRRVIREYGIFYLIGGLTVLWIKYRYGHAGCEELRWILAPAAAWSGRLGNLSFVYERGVGYVNHSIRFIIAPSCSGIQFLTIVLGMLVFTFVHRMGTRRRSALWMLCSLAGAYGYTVFVNGIRIVLAVRIPVWLSAAGISPAWLTQGRLHTIIGAAVYFGALLLLHRAADLWLCFREASAGAASRETEHKRSMRELAPIFWYFFIVLGVPFLNRALVKDREGYVEYAVLTGCVCLTALAARRLAGSAFRMFGNHLKML